MDCLADGCPNKAINGRDGCHECLMHPDSPITDYEYIDMIESWNQANA